MKQNKTIKYLKYAIGEIILITIGILIAVQINSYKTYQNNRVIEKQLLLKLKTDLQNDTFDLNRLLQTKKGKRDACNYMFEFFDNPLKPISDTAKYKTGVFYPLGSSIDYNPHNTIFELAKSSGDLFKITNDTLIETITVYFTDNSLSQHLSTTKEYILDFYSLPTENYPINPDKWTTQSIQGYFKDFRIENLYLLLHSLYGVDIKLINEKMDKATKLMEQIDHEIHQRGK
jgi:hypothetical protein